MSKLHSARACLCSTLAIATVLIVGASPAAAQALLGTVTSSTGVGTIYNHGSSTTIPVTSRQAVINWHATGPNEGGVTTFSNSGSTTRFTGQSNFAVLNRVAPTVAGSSILLSGNITSLVNGQVGGTVYFYSPNGIVVGSNATINVGSLGLTTLPISDVRGVWMSGFGTSMPQVAFGAASNAASLVRTSDGSVISANGPGNYVALVAPRVEHRGTIRTDSGAALVAAGAATITFNPSGLFDIAIPTGSSDANGVVVDGGRIERNSAAVGGPHRAYLVSVPANNAMTMLVQGGAQLGFDVAGSAAVEGNAVVLSAGRSSLGGPSAGASGVTIDHATIGSDLVIDATASVRISSSAGAISLLRGASVNAVDSISVIADNHRLTISGSLVASTNKNNGAGGVVTVRAQNGQTLAVAGSVLATANGSGPGAAGDGLNSGNGGGGMVNLQAVGGGSLTIGGGLDAQAAGFGGSNGFGNGAAGSGTGGLINVDAVGGNSGISVGGFAVLDASGSGGSAIECTRCAVAGGAGSGGTINVSGRVRAVNSGPNRLEFNGGLSMIATGTGGSGDAGAGTGQGGVLRLVTSDATVVTSRMGLAMAASGIGGNYLGAGAGAGGDGTGGQAQIGAYDAARGSFVLSGTHGQIALSAKGIGGNTNGSGTGGTGQGGRIAIDAKGAAITLGGDVVMDAAGEGGDALNSTGGSAVGGSVFAHAFGKDLTIGGTLTQLATAVGGNGRSGGLGQGGTVSTAVDTGSTLKVSGQALLDATGIGGHGGAQSGNRGGRAQGGDASLFAGSGGSLAVGSVFLSAFAIGGGGFEGGAAQGGHGAIASNLGKIDISGAVFGFVGANGGSSNVATGGAATGGRFELITQRGAIDVGGTVTLGTDARGGLTFGDFATGGSGTGGGLQVQAREGGTLTLRSALFAASEGHGGEATAMTARAGDGFGGSVVIGAVGTNATLEARGFVSVAADGFGGIAICGECSTGAAGGNGTGGLATVQASGGTGNRIITGSGVQISANGHGSNGYGGTGGNGHGGTASVFLADDARITVAGGLGVSARGNGGYQSNGGQAGAGTGGEALINLAGGATSLLTVGTNSDLETDPSTTLDSSGYGGSAGAIAGGIGGTGTGGWSHIYGTGGSAIFAGNVTIEAEGEGGDGENGAGGAGVGGRARLNADGAAYHLLANATMMTDARGGDGRNGGGAALRNTDNENNSAIFANHGGSVVVDGAAIVSANAEGGSGLDGGNGGSANAGLANVVVNGSALGNGAITLARLTITANATGGSGATGNTGSAGGTGGKATGGIAELATNNSASGTNRLTVGSASLGALAKGGEGGTGADGVRGGNGGGGTGGTAIALSGAGNGAYSVTDLSIAAQGSGGRGGDGGSGASGRGGAGGTGGTGDGGVVVAGIASGAATATTNGIFTAATLIGAAGSHGGNGGDGGVGALGSGTGGNGGDALLSFNQLLARGGTVTVGTARMVVDAVGGNGGLGGINGNGGTAFTPDILVTATNRFNQPTARAALIVGTLDFRADAHAGTGKIAGRAIAQGGPQFLVQNSDARFGSLSMVSTAGDGIDPASFANPVRIINGIVSLDAGFRFETDHRMTVLVDQGSLTAGQVTLDAASFERDSTVPPPTARGTISAGSFALSSKGALIIDADLRSGRDVLVDVPGEVAIGDIATVAQIGVRAGGTIKLGVLDSGSFTDLRAVGAIDVGTITANGAVTLQSSGGSVTAGTIGARGVVALDAGSRLIAGNISGSEAVRLVSKGTTQVGNVDAGGLISAESSGNFGSGALTGRSILLRSGGLLTTANLTSTQAGIDVAAVGPVALADIVSASTFIAKSDANLTLGTLRTSGAAAIDVGGTITTGTIDAGSVDFAAGRNIAVGQIVARGSVRLDAGGALMASDATAGESIALVAAGTVRAGNLSAGLVSNAVREGADYNIGILSRTSVAVGNVSARDWIGIGTRGALTVEAISSGNDVLLAADGAIATGAITTGGQSRLLIAGGDMVALGGPIDAFDRSRLFAALGTSAEAATRGTVTIRGPVNTGRMDALVGGDFSAGALSATNAAFATVGGTMAIEGAWTAALTRIGSNDIAIGVNGAIRGGRTDLVSRNATQLLVGDGLSGSGYAIDNAEFGRLSAGIINVFGRSDASAAIDTLVGTLSLTARSGGSRVTIASASGSANEPAGSLRVTGAVSGTGFGANDALTLAAGRVAVDATTGRISLGGSSGPLGGALTLNGQQIHIAEGAILDRLAADPNYAARDADLARAPLAQRPDGVVRAGKIVVELVNPAGQVSTAVGTAALMPYSVLVQNVGSRQIPAGFTATTTEIVAPTGTAPRSIDLNVNGQLITATGTLTGVAVRDALMAADNPARFTLASLINGCALTGPCGTVLPPFDPHSAISTEIVLLSTSLGDDPLFGNEETIEDNEEDGGDDSASSPITPPVPLFNTKPLEQDGDTDEPVSGGGNPALIGSGRVGGGK